MRGDSCSQVRIRHNYDWNDSDIVLCSMEEKLMDIILH